ncbi:hypothetical protein [Planctomyces sp. SH-PL62]|uniref:hypothetical protein n=1 Tax=Planctomyces sp. SH-PL62 TaxID=1636152 RepID=UPI00078C2668|nr:hypothetical protein [Planctomyces sp. SH-PL62]AMV36724.1 hypothetical protein VT85_04790 [Planctomyces sp. SH-PL62]
MIAMNGRRRFSRWLPALLLAAVAGGAAVGQEASEAALRDRVLQLVERLGADKPEARDAAEAALVKLGARALPLLPDPAGLPKESADRLARVRESIGKDGPGDDPTKPSRVTLKAKGIRLSDALLQLQKQTGNPITDLREQYGVEATNPSIDLDLDGAPFLEALDEVARRADVGITPYTGDGSIGIMGGRAEAAAGAAATTSTPLQYVGPFRVTLRQFTAMRDFQTGAASANAALEIAWEPRIRPMLMAIKADQVEVRDDQGRTVKPQVAAESSDVVLRPENPSADVNVNLEAPDRSAMKLATFRVKAEMTLPADVKTFRFPNLAEKKTIQQGEVGVTLEGVEVDEQVWKVGVVLSYPGEGPAFESYRQGLFNNRLWLQKADGSKFEQNGGFSNTGSDGGRLGFEYLFVDAPGKPEDYQLVYETPSRVVTVPVEFTFRDVPLP